MSFTDFKGVVFDLDGTLVESNYVWSEIDKKFLGKRGIAVPADYFKAVSAMNYRAAAVYTNQRFSLNENIEDIMQEWVDMAEYEYANNVQLVSGADKYLKLLKSKGIKICLATASSKELYEPVLKHHGIYELFDAFTTTSEVERGKGFPDVYELAAKKISLPPKDCAVFEDIIEGIRGAKAGSFTAVACLNSHYIADWQQLKAESDKFFSDYSELM